MALKKSQLYSSLWQNCDELRGGKQGMMQRLPSGRVWRRPEQNCRFS